MRGTGAGRRSRRQEQEAGAGGRRQEAGAGRRTQDAGGDEIEILRGSGGLAQIER